MMNQQPPLQGMANQMAQYGRYGDSMLVHMNPAEVQGIAALSPTGSLTTNPVTGQPEAFLPFLAPLLGSFLGSSFLTGAGAGILGGAGLSSAAAGAIGSGLATTAVTGDLKQGILSGLTGYGIGEALGAAGDALNPDIAIAEDALSNIDDAMVGTTADLAGAQADLMTVPPVESAVMPDLPGMAAPQMNPAVAPDLPGMAAPQMSPVSSPGFDPSYPAAVGNVQGLESQLASQQATRDVLQGNIADMREAMTPTDRLSAPFQNPGTFGKALMSPSNLAPIAVGEGQREQMRLEDEFARNARQYEQDKRDEYERNRRGMESSFDRIRQDYGYSQGGVTSINPQNYKENLDGLRRLTFNEGGEIPDNNYFIPGFGYGSGYGLGGGRFGAGTPADRQASIRPSTTISPEQLEGYRPGFDPEIMYFQTPPPPPPEPTDPGFFANAMKRTESPDGSDNTTAGINPFSGINYFGGGFNFDPSVLRDMDLSDFDFEQFSQSPVGREAMDSVRQITGDPRFESPEPVNTSSMILPPSTGAIDLAGDDQLAGLGMSFDFGKNSKLPSTMYSPGSPMPDPVMSTSPPDMEELISRMSAERRDDEPRRRSGAVMPSMGEISMFNEGGETEMAPDDGTRIIDLTIAAVVGELPEEQAEVVINRFIDEFGAEAFSALRKQVLESVVPGAQTEGEITGNGGGMDDEVPGMIGKQQPVAVSPGEFIVPADVVSGIGDGSTDAGVDELYGMMDRVRSERTGMRQQPKPIDKTKVMPV